jgi:hypothetical protein
MGEVGIEEMRGIKDLMAIRPVNFIIVLHARLRAAARSINQD